MCIQDGRNSCTTRELGTTKLQGAKLQTHQRCPDWPGSNGIHSDTLWHQDGSQTLCQGHYGTLQEACHSTMVSMCCSLNFGFLGEVFCVLAMMEEAHLGDGIIQNGGFGTCKQELVQLHKQTAHTMST